MAFPVVDLLLDTYRFDILWSLLVRDSYQTHYYTKYNHILLVGKAIHVNQNIDPTSEDIDKLHNEYLQAIQQLYEDNKTKYGLSHVELEII